MDKEALIRVVVDTNKAALAEKKVEVVLAEANSLPVADRTVAGDSFPDVVDISLELREHMDRMVHRREGLDVEAVQARVRPPS